jgi:hypothetical protein
MAYTGTGEAGKVYTAGGLTSSPKFHDIGTASGLTDRGVVIAKGSAAFQATAQGYNGQVLIGNTAGNPAFATISSSNSSIGFAAGANSLDMTVNKAATFPNVTTNYAVVCAGSSDPANLQSIASVGTSGQVLTSNGAGALPSFTTISASATYFPMFTVAPWNVSITTNYSSTTNTTVTNLRAYYSWVIITQTVTIATLRVRVTTNVAGSTGRLGIYNDDGFGRPGTLKVDGGTFSLASLGNIAVTVNTQLTPGLYWTCCTINNNAGAPAITQSSNAAFPGYDFSTPSLVRSYIASSIDPANPLPDPATISQTTNLSALPLVGLSI